MSLLVNDTLLPRAQVANNQHEQWVGKGSNRRQTWLTPVDQSDVPERVCTEEINVERRPSWAGRDSGELLDDDEIGLQKGKDQFLVQWDEGDVENPLNFGKGKKWMNAMILAFACFMVSIASSGFSQGDFFVLDSENSRLT